MHLYPTTISSESFFQVKEHATNSRRIRKLLTMNDNNLPLVSISLRFLSSILSVSLSEGEGGSGTNTTGVTLE